MSRYLGILVAAALAAASTAALAKDDGVKTARQQAKETYKMDKQGCKGMPKEERDTCRHRAKAQYDQEIGEVKKMKASNAKQDKAAKAEKRDAKNRLDEHSGGDDSYKQSSSGASKLPTPGAQSDLSKPTSKREPAQGMGKAPETATGPNNGS